MTRTIDPARVYTPAEERQLALNLDKITDEVYRGALRGQPIAVNLLRLIHGRLFAGVRSHAGQCRRVGFGTEYLTFGPNRSVSSLQVLQQLEEVFDKVRRSVASLDASPEAGGYDEAALRTAVWTHAEVVRIHPFEDGNGRSSRLLMNWLLVRLGLRPIALEAVKEEYNLCLNHYFIQRDLEPLFDLCLRLYPLS